jgi:5'-nucleotidase
VLFFHSGWAADNLHAGKAALERQGHKVLIIGPLENQSGSGGTVDLPTTNVTESGGIYG